MVTFTFFNLNKKAALMAIIGVVLLVGLGVFTGSYALASGYSFNLANNTHLKFQDDDPFALQDSNSTNLLLTFNAYSPSFGACSAPNFFEDDIYTTNGTHLNDYSDAIYGFDDFTSLPITATNISFLSTRFSRPYTGPIYIYLTMSDNNGSTICDSVLLGSYTIVSSFANTAPAFSSGPSDGGSSASAPTIVGNTVQFTATATDPDSDNYYLAICKTNSITAVNNGPPTCPGGAWGISSSTASGSSASVSYTTQQADIGTNAWFGFVCDNTSNSLCSASSQGSGSAASPFQVNLQTNPQGGVAFFLLSPPAAKPTTIPSGQSTETVKKQLILLIQQLIQKLKIQLLAVLSAKINH